MGFLERLVVGTVIMERVLEEQGNLLTGRRTTSLLVCERHGKRKLFFKYSAWWLFAGSTSYEEFPVSRIARLYGALNEAEELLH